MRNMSRNKLIQLIHVAKKQLSLSDENYRALITQVKSKAKSCTDLNLFQLGELYQLMRTAGFQATKIPNRTSKMRPRYNSERSFATQEQLYYIRGLWSLASRNKSEDSLNKMCKRITGVDLIQWLDIPNATKLILALRKIATKEGYETRARELKHFR